MAHTATIRNWTIVHTEDAMFLKGHAFGHINPEYAKDNDLILTSSIIGGGEGFVITHCGSYKVE